MTREADRRISLHIHSAPDDPKARELALTMVLQRKGRVLDALAGTAATLRRRLNPQDQTTFDRLNDETTKLAQLVLNGPDAGETAAVHDKRVKELETQREQLEEDASLRNAGLYQTSQPVTIEDVRRELPESAALIEFVVYHPSDARVATEHDTPTEPHYAAYVLRSRGEVQWKELGPAKEIDAAVDALRQALRDPARADVKALARALDERVLQPLRVEAGDATQLLIAPDGELNLIPFEALVDERGHYLVEHYSFVYLTSGRDLMRMRVTRANRSAPVIVADPTFGEPTAIATNNRARAGNGGSVRPGSSDSQIFFGPLPGVAEEVRELRLLLPQASFITKDQATKAALEKLSAPSILHLATHGFFLSEARPDRPPAAANGAATGLPDGTRSVSATVRTENPLLRSGLALAGANQTGVAGSDGILTALEAAGLDLWGTKLVVLSACDTGVGEVKNGDGVYGLRRAFVLAGTESQVMSLWPVSDRSTRDLIVGYYRALLQGAGRSEALRRVQLAMLHDKAHSHPYYWAGFIESGEWANLDGKR
jgi:CHAT domain-containing protein